MVSDVAVTVSRARVLFVGAFPSAERKVFGGMVTSCRALLGSSLPRRLDLDLLDSTQASHPPPRLHVRLVLAARRFCTFLLRFGRHRPDAVLLFAAVGASVVEKGAMAWYARLRGVPALMFPRGGAMIDACERSAFTRWWVRLAFGGARMVLCQGPTWRSFACDVLGFDSANAPIVPNWTATDEFLAIGRGRSRQTNHVVRLLFVGWLDAEKGITELLMACRTLLADRPLELVLVGEGNMSEKAREFVKAQSLTNAIRFRGWLEGDALRAEYAAADAFVLPSWYEGLPNAMVEAMAAKLAIVVSAVGNIPDVVADGASALLIRPRDADALTTALARVIDDASLRERIAAAAFDIAEERFGVEAAVTKISACVERALGRCEAAN
jgi:glycosyltransferase involved in cell wall biosynthesis